MPWALLLRLLSLGFFYRLARKRRAQSGAPGRNSPGVSPEAVVASMRQRATRAAGIADVTVRILAASALLAVAVVVGTAAISTVVLGPRWLGAVFGIIALIAAADSYRCGHSAWRTWQQQRWRRRMAVTKGTDD